MDFRTKMRYSLINSTRGYFSMASDLQSEYDVPYYAGEDFFDRKHRLNVHYHAGTPPEEGQSDYGTDGGQTERTKLPVVVFIHGGGWKRGDRNYVFDVYNNFAKSIASEGFVCVVPSYRLSMPGDGGVQHPAHACDVAHALSWVKNNIHKYSGDADMVFLSGHSAGGHLAALLTLDVRYLADVGLEPDFVKGVVGICGVYDLVTGYQRYLMRKLYLIDAFGHDEEVLREASPVHHARSNVPPFFLINASMDFGLENDSLLLRQALLACEGNSVEHRLYAGTDHAYIIGLTFAWGKAFPPLVQDVLTWLKKQVVSIQQNQRGEQGEQRESSEEELEGTEEEREATTAEFGQPVGVSQGASDPEPVCVLRAVGWE